MMKTSGKRIAPTSTVTPARVRMFQPTQRPTASAGAWIGTSWGRCRVVGRLGQRHADLLESVLFVAEKRRTIEDGGIELLVDPARLRKCLSDDRHSFGRIKTWLEELMQAVIEVQTVKISVIGHLLDHIEESPKTKSNPLTGGTRHLWRVRIGKPLVVLLENDMHLFHDPAPIARLQHGISQAVARHVLTHKTEPRGGWYMDTLIQAVAGDVCSQAMRDARRRLRDDTAGLQAIGLAVEGDRIRKIHDSGDRGAAAR